MDRDNERRNQEGLPESISPFSFRRFGFGGLGDFKEYDEHMKRRFAEAEAEADAVTAGRNLPGGGYEEWKGTSPQEVYGETPDGKGFGYAAKSGMRRVHYKTPEGEGDRWEFPGYEGHFEYGTFEEGHAQERIHQYRKERAQERARTGEMEDVNVLMDTNLRRTEEPKPKHSYWSSFLNFFKK